jgi:hypothetical protein
MSIVSQSQLCPDYMGSASFRLLELRMVWSRLNGHHVFPSLWLRLSIPILQVLAAQPRGPIPRNSQLQGFPFPTESGTICRLHHSLSHSHSCKWWANKVRPQMCGSSVLVYGWSLFGGELKECGISLDICPHTALLYRFLFDRCWCSFLRIYTNFWSSKVLWSLSRWRFSVTHLPVCQEINTCN